MKKSLLLISLGLACISGCEKKQEVQEKPVAKQPVQEEKKFVSESPVIDKIVREECQITETQQGSVSFAIKQMYGFHHDFVFLSCSNVEKNLILLYPNSRLFRRGIVEVQYKPLRGGKLKSSEFVRAFMEIGDTNGDYYRDLKKSDGYYYMPEMRIDIFDIYADGVIEDIKYKD